MKVSPETVFANLQKLDGADKVTSAIYREQAQEILATPTVELATRIAIAEKLQSANRLLAMQAIENEDSY
jgi:hypothetical protein